MFLLEILQNIENSGLHHSIIRKINKKRSRKISMGWIICIICPLPQIGHCPHIGNNVIPTSLNSFVRFEALQIVFN